MASRSLAVSSLLSVSDRICTVAVDPFPTTTTDWGLTPMAWAKVSSTWVTLASPLAPACGNDILVPPSKSMPNVKPRNTMLAIAIPTIRKLMPNHILRRPTTSKAPVPV